VRIFERSKSPRELGFALNLAPNAMAALRELGLADQLNAAGHVPVKFEVRSADGRLLKRLNVTAGMAAGGPPPLVALRPALHGALLNATNPDALVLDSEAVGFEVTPGGVALALADGRSASADILIGADGVGSIIRRHLRPNEPPARPSGYCAVRGVAYDAGHHLGGVSAVLYLGRGIEAATAQASQSAVYWYVSLLAEDVPSAMRDPSAIVKKCAGALDGRFQAIVRATAAEDLRFDELFDRDPIEEWGDGPVTLLGDAAHSMLPHTGQGAAQALEDAVALGLALASDRDPLAALRLYERARAKKTGRIVRLGRRIARITTTKSPLILWLRAAALWMMPAKMVLAAFHARSEKDLHRELRR
jgi:2-polyprenyl-6-methoxyphenol hydroxylase-like FAD-dependent oxidoreductase